MCGNGTRDIPPHTVTVALRVDPGLRFGTQDSLDGQLTVWEPVVPAAQGAEGLDDRGSRAWARECLS
ncbi:hypothetical protein GCM10010503_41150 [Streptomyces lucensis JCM 4490]|uniref:Uncharacterized protein n=1 Tax=Streptomyces lucensis JCM 4490 TaxID=1306176 RepID=A0A918MSE9_9ACTN|nr:hypothetical protein GCM10010503_41150 [Streptomyces lucensis JCM 4490]